MLYKFSRFAYKCNLYRYAKVQRSSRCLPMTSPRVFARVKDLGGFGTAAAGGVGAPLVRRILLGRDTSPLTVPERAAVRLVVTLIRAKDTSGDGDGSRNGDGDGDGDGVGDEDGDGDGDGEEEEEEMEEDGGAAKGRKKTWSAGSKRAAAERAKETSSYDKRMTLLDKRNDVTGITPRNKQGYKISVKIAPAAAAVEVTIVAHVRVGLALPGGVSDWVHGPHWQSSTAVLIAKYNVKSDNPTCGRASCGPCTPCVRHLTSPPRLLTTTTSTSRRAVTGPDTCASPPPWWGAVQVECSVPIA
jgi:hypothetical protein